MQILPRSEGPCEGGQVGQSEVDRTSTAVARATPQALGESAARAEPSALQDVARRVGVRPRSRFGLTFMVCSVMMVISMLMVISNLQNSSLGNANTGSRYATIQSLVDFHSFYIDKSQYIGTVDKYKLRDHYISSKPTTLPLIGAGIYGAYKWRTNKTISRYERDVVRMVGFCTGGVGHIVFLIYFYRLCRLLFRRQLSVILAMAGASFAYLGVGYATHLNELSTAGALAICGFYYAVRIRQESDSRPWHWPLAGFVLGLLPAIYLPALAISGLIGLYLFTHDKRKTLLWFLPALMPGLLLHLTLTYQISGSFKPFYLNSELRNFKESYFKNPGGIDKLREPKLKYAFNTLLGHHGLFSMTPLYLFGLYELVHSLKARRLFAESLVVATTVATFSIFFIWRTRNYGGECVGMRWFVPLMPLLLLYFGLWLDRVRLTRPLWGLVLLAFSVSAFNVQDALVGPYRTSSWQKWLSGAAGAFGASAERNMRQHMIAASGPVAPASATSTSSAPSPNSASRVTHSPGC